MNYKVRSYLIELARKKVDQVITYQKFSDACELGLNMRDNPHDRKIIGNILGDISVHEHQDGKRHSFSALSIRAGDNYEGDSFYKLAEQLGFGKWQDLKKEGVFEAEQIGKCIEFWSDNDNYRLYR